MKEVTGVINQPLAHIHPEAIIGEGVVIEPFVTIHANVEIGDGCHIMSNAVIHEGARLGKRVKVFPGAVISSIPQDLKFEGEDSLALIGDDTVVREYATVNRGTAWSGQTVVGKQVLLMAYSHVAHDCVIGDHAILANAVNLAGHVNIDPWAIIGGMSAVHQFVRIGRHSILSGGSLVGKDVLPYTKAGKYPLSYAGVNLIGLKRRGFEEQTITEIQQIYQALYREGRNVTQAMQHLESEFAPSAIRDEILEFVRSSRRGILKVHSGASHDDAEG